MRTAILLAGMLLSSTVLADANAIGYVKTVNGEASITTAGKKSKSRSGYRDLSRQPIKNCCEKQYGHHL